MSAARDQRATALGAAAPQSGAQPDAYDAATIHQLNALTSDFYAREAASFSATRQAPWRGWDEAWELIGTHSPAFARSGRDASAAGDTALSVLDLGCGNLRFEHFLAKCTDAPLRVTALDNCPALAATAKADLPDTITVEFQTLDLVESLLGGTFAERLPHETCDLAVAFGLMHHLPTFALRTRLLTGLLESLRPGGFAIVSFWQPLNDPRLAAKAAATTAEGRAALGLPAFRENDFLLGWQQAQGVYRFCHHTPEQEIDALLAAMDEPDALSGSFPSACGRSAVGYRAVGPLPLREVGRANIPSAGNRPAARPFPFCEVGRFSADGKQGTLNRYVVLQRS